MGTSGRTLVVRALKSLQKVTMLIPNGPKAWPSLGAALAVAPGTIKRKRPMMDMMWTRRKAAKKLTKGLHGKERFWESGLESESLSFFRGIMRSCSRPLGLLEVFGGLTCGMLSSLERNDHIWPQQKLQSLLHTCLLVNLSHKFQTLRVRPSLTWKLLQHLSQQN